MATIGVLGLMFIWVCFVMLVLVDVDEILSVWFSYF